MLRTGKPKAQISGSQQTQAGTKPNLPEENQEYVPVDLTTYRNEFGDALQAAFNSLSVGKAGTENEPKPNAKKKKSKGKILFSL